MPRPWHKPPITAWITMVVVCACTIAVTLHQINDHPTKTKVKQIVQGDGYLTASQCQGLERATKQVDMRERYGVPADYQDSDQTTWAYPLREDHERHCTIMFSNWYGPFRKGVRIDSVELELKVP